jgi:hypothetical protein
VHRFVWRDKRRTNVPVGPLRNHLNGINVERHCYRVLRYQPEAFGGHLPSERTGHDRDAGACTDRSRCGLALHADGSALISAGPCPAARGPHCGLPATAVERGPRRRPG